MIGAEGRVVQVNEDRLEAGVDLLESGHWSYAQICR